MHCEETDQYNEALTHLLVRLNPWHLSFFCWLVTLKPIMDEGGISMDPLSRIMLSSFSKLGPIISFFLSMSRLGS